MKARAIILAAATAASFAAALPLTATADAPAPVRILAFPCQFAPPPETGLWVASGAITDSGTFERTAAASSPPNRPPLTNGPFRETFVFSGAMGSFTVSAEERLTDAGVVGVWQIRPDGSGAYAATSGHGEVSFAIDGENGCQAPFNRFVFSLTGVASKVG
jgi:hypothetical protein